jgi:glutamate decarboxylase
MPPASRAGKKRHIDAVDSQDDFTSVYGSRFAIQDLPSEDIPEESMPPEIAYRMIKDELSLDNNPKLKYVNCMLPLAGC